MGIERELAEGGGGQGISSPAYGRTQCDTGVWSVVSGAGLRKRLRSNT